MTVGFDKPASRGPHPPAARTIKIRPAEPERRFMFYTSETGDQLAPASVVRHNALAWVFWFCVIT